MKKIFRCLLAGLFLTMLLAGCTFFHKENREVVRRIEEGKPGIAMITDSGSISDKSFNQASYEAILAFAEENNIPFVAKKPENNDDASREEMVRLAIAEGYTVIVLPGYSFASCIVNCSFDYPDVKFIALDISEDDLLTAALGDSHEGSSREDVTKYYNTQNCYLVTYKEEVAGFMAGYAAVKMGYSRLGFVGGVEVPAVQRYGYGFLQGANAAAKELDKTDRVSVRYVYAETFQPNVQIYTTCMDWFKKGTELIFSCGGGIYTSVAEAAFKYDRKVIGVDVDQAESIDLFGKGLTLTSATKGLGASVTDALTSIFVNNTWDKKVGKIVKLGLVSFEDVSLNYVQLGEHTQWCESFDEEDYRQLVEYIMHNKYIISDYVKKLPELSISVDFFKIEYMEE